MRLIGQLLTYCTKALVIVLVIVSRLLPASHRNSLHHRRLLPPRHRHHRVHLRHRLRDRQSRQQTVRAISAVRAIRAVSAID